MEVTFEDVHFLRNGRRNEHIFGAAVRSSACLNSPCPKRLLRFISCHFSENTSLQGGAIFAENADVEIANCVFVHNRAMLNGGALCVRHSQSATLNIVDSDFDGNEAQWDDTPSYLQNLDLLDTLNQTLSSVGAGGAIFAENPAAASIGRSVFANNTGCQGGGAIAVVHGGILPEQNSTYSLRIHDSLFDDNAAFCGKPTDGLEIVLGRMEVRGGGSLFYNSLDETLIAWDIRNTSFERNWANLGGALFFQSFQPSAAQHTITNCSFSENIGLRAGGSLMALGSRVLIKSNRITQSRSTFGGGICLWNKACVSSTEDPDRPGIPNIVEGCTAIYGGGLFADSSGTPSPLSHRCIAEMR